MKHCSKKVYAHREHVKLWIRGMLITYCVCDFLFYGYPCMKKEKMMLKCKNNYGT